METRFDTLTKEAARLHGIHIEDVTQEMRDRTKIIYYLRYYGMSEERIKRIIK